MLSILLVLPLVQAGDSISKSDFIIEIYNNTIHITSNDYSGNNKDFNFSITNRSEFTSTNFSTDMFYVPYSKYNFSFFFVNNISIGWDIVEKYTSCLNDTSTCQLNAAANFTQYSITNTQKDNELNNRQTRIDDLTKQKTETENQKYIIGAICLAVGFILRMFLKGEIGKNFNKKSEEFNPHGTG